MTKRFISDKWQVYDNDTILSVDETVELLNKLDDENEQLVKRCKTLQKSLNECIVLEEENEQLKSEIQMLKTTIGRNEAYIKRLTEKGEWK